MLRVAIVGCGKIADDHAAQMQRIPDCRIIGVCDNEPLMARQLAERFAVEHQSTDLTEMLARARPDVVHITTPPQSHFDLGQLCLDHGCHIYVEKPFTIDKPEADKLIAQAEAKGLKVTVGHDDQFSKVSQRMRSLVQSGYLGGKPVHMESSFCYDLSDPSYARALLTTKEHWVRKLPGQLMHNIISHGVARIAEFLSGDNLRITAHGFVSPALKRLGETDLLDELRAIISDGDGRTTAYFTFSSQMRPQLHEFRIYGPDNGLIVDQDHDTLIRLRGAKFKSYADKFVPSLSFASQYLCNFAFNARSFLKSDFHMKGGMKALMESFYKSIVEGTPVPIPYREILLTAQIMDAIFAQLQQQRELAAEPQAR